jgi:predicted ATPase/DNA-binding SARP family transcriptional activator
VAARAPRNATYLRLLGPVRIDGGQGPRGISGAKPRAVLASMALRIGHVIGVEQFIDDLWGEAPPATARNTVQVYISAVRRALDETRGPLRVERMSSGYGLYGSAEHVDWHLFQALTSQCRRWAGLGDHRTAAGLADRALALWDGTPLADIGSSPLRDVFAPGMEAARQAALADRIDAELASGRTDLVPELLAAVARHPLDERFVGQLMRAHWHAGNRTAALDAYTDLCHRLGGGSGLETTTRNRMLYHAILAGDPPPRPAEPTTAPAAPALDRRSDRLVGREAELAALATLLDTGAPVTVTGPPGVGKSRLAHEFGSGLGSAGTTRVGAVRLDGVRAPDDLVSAIVDVLGPAASTRLDAMAYLRAQLLGRDTLLILDNCDHLAAECAELVGRLRADRPQARFLMTSTRPLDLPGEVCFPLAPLPIPETGSATVEDVLRSPAVQLFLDRARQSRPSFTITADTAVTVASICRRVDGLPLAIELAAARVGLLSPPELAALLADRQEMLRVAEPAGGAPTDHRRQSLHGALAATCELLSAEDRAVFAALAWFSGGFTRTAAGAVAGPDRPATDLVDRLQVLVDRSLLSPDLTGEETRFRMLEPVRQYGRRLLDEPGREVVARRHARHFADLAATAAAERRGPRRAYWQQRLAAERADLTAALDWAVHHDLTGIGLDLAAHLWWWWVNTPHAGLRWYRRLVAAGAEPAVPRHRMLPTLLSAAVIASYVSNIEAMGYAETALRVSEEIGDEASTVRALQHIADIAYERGDLRLATDTGDRAVALAGRTGEPYAVARCQLTVAYNHLAATDFAGARAWADRAGRTFLATAEAAALAGDLDAAEPILARILVTFRRAGSDEQVARAATLLAWVLSRTDSPADAADLLAEAFDIHLAVGHPWSVAHDLDLVAGVHAHVGAHAHAATLLAAADGVRADADLRPMPSERTVRADVERMCRARLGPAGYRTAAREGAATTLESALALARIPPRMKKS